MNNNIFSFVKEHIRLSEFVQSLPQTQGLHSTGENKYRCNNVIAGGTNHNAMVIDDDIGFFKVFSHGQEKGDVITLYNLTMGGGNLSARDAAIGLASMMSLSIPEEYLMINSSHIGKKDMIETMNSICSHTHEYLVNSEDDCVNTMHDYLTERGIHEELIDTWSLGMLPDDMKESQSVLRKYGSDDTLQKVGLFGGKNKDFVSMTGRLLFPIFSLNGDCISFSSRSVPGVFTPLGDSKYVNTSTTDIYDKSSTLYGQHLLKKDLKRIIICEGNLDVIALNEMTDEDTVALATCGTALTENHVGLIKRFSPEEVVIVFDSDEAGRNSMSNLVWLANHFEKVGIYLIESGKDPWDMYIQGVPGNKIRYNEPISITACRMMHNDKDRDEFLDWFVKSYKSLNFSDDKYNLLQTASQSTGLKQKFLESLVSQSKTYTQNNREKQVENPISPHIQQLISAMLSLDMSDKKAIFFPLYINSQKDKALNYCGIFTKQDEDAISIALGIHKDRDSNITTHVYDLAPQEEDIDTIMKEASRFLAKNIFDTWKKDGIPQGMSQWVRPLSVISSGMSSADAYDQLSFVFDMIASS